MQFCYNCGKFFPDEDIVKQRDTETCLHTYCCPHCGVDDIGESEECAICGKEFPEGEISHGFCLGCLWEAIDYDVALAYMKDHVNWLAEFILRDWFGASFDSIGTNDTLDAFLDETFRRLVADEKLRTGLSEAEKPKFLEACREFCLPCYHNGDFGCEGEQFAEWYARRKKEAKS